MADTKISALTAYTSPISTDVLPIVDVTAGTTKKITVANLMALAAGNPTGAILMWPTASAPTGYLILDGSAVSRTTYATLFALIGTTFGAGDGSTTFNLPDMRGRTAVGAGTGTKVATFASRSSNVITATGLTNAANNEFQTGQAVVYSSTSTDIGGLTNGTTYYLIRLSATTFSLAVDLPSAQNNIPITLSSDGAGTRKFTLTFTTRALGDTGGEENHAMSSTELLSHTHSINYSSNSFQSYHTSSGGGQYPTGDVVGATGGNAAMNTRDPFTVLNYIIKY